ncbi:glutathione hydrolase 3-like protein, partial [Tanacetum coccineum]
RSQLLDHGTSHFCIVDDDRNAVSLTTTVNYAFGGGVLSQSTGIVLNNEMGDFSVPTEESSDELPPSPSNFIKPNKRPLSSMTPIIVLKDDQLAGVIGGSGGMYIIPAVAQVFINHFILGMDPPNAVQSPRVYHKLIPNVVYYENWTVIDGDHIELSEDRKKFLVERGHELEPKAGGAICQLVIQTLKKPNVNRKLRYDQQEVLKGMLTANAANGSLGLHRSFEALKHMCALRMSLGDPDFMNVITTVANMISPAFAKNIQERIFYNTTFPSTYYMPRLLIAGGVNFKTMGPRAELPPPLHGTSHFCIVNDDRNAVSLTTTVNYAFGGGVLSQSIGIVLNNEMGHFSVPTEVSSDKLPPSPSNFHQSFYLGYGPSECRSVTTSRPQVYYENWTVIDGDHIELSED